MSPDRHFPGGGIFSLYISLVNIHFPYTQFATILTFKYGGGGEDSRDRESVGGTFILGDNFTPPRNKSHPLLLWGQIKTFFSETKVHSRATLRRRIFADAEQIKIPSHNNACATGSLIYARKTT